MPAKPRTSNGNGNDHLARAQKPKRGRVFVIDDDRSVLALLGAIFRGSDFEVHTYLQAEQALTDVHDHQPDVIILDLEMPAMNGRSFYRALRDAGVTTPVLILSAYGARRAQMELGADAYADKPFEPDELIEQAARLLR